MVEVALSVQGRRVTRASGGLRPCLGWRRHVEPSPRAGLSLSSQTSTLGWRQCG